jgi:PII-like signaling protein
MRGSQLTVYVASQSQRVQHRPVVEWILDEATHAGIRGATVVDVAESIDVKGHYHAARFFELAEQSVAVTVIAGDEPIDRLLAALNAGGVRLFYTRARIDYDTPGADAAS